MKGGVRKRGSSWYYYFDVAKVDGKRKKIERKGGNTKREAQTALREAIREFEHCGSVTDESNISVSDYLDYWFNEYVMINCKYNTQTLYKCDMKYHIKPIIGKYKLKSITPLVLQQLLNQKYKEGFSKSTISTINGILSKSFRMAVYPYKLLKENPLQYVNMPKFKNKKEDNLKIISIKDFNKIIERFSERSNMYIPLQIGFNTGLRVGEICGLTWDCIDFKKKTLTVDKSLKLSEKKWSLGTPKTQSSYRTILIGDTLIKILKKHKKHQIENKLKYGNYYTDSNFVCTKKNGQILTPESLRYISRIVNRELKINFKIHSLRHTHATMLLESGANIKDIQQRLGHSNLSTTMDTYSHVTQNLKQDSINKFESYVYQK